jgi:predicted nuclease of predicted toxin-antitoxin system
VKPTFIVDLNLPYHFELWNNPRFIHLKDINDEWSDEEIWEYTRKKNLIIITKDADFSNKIIVKNPPPKVIHIRVGNLKINALHNFLNSNWHNIERKIRKFKLINVYPNRIEGIK